MHVRPRRSALYMPGSNARALDKARGLPADVLILDLEDAVAPDAKERARSQVAAAVTARGYGHREVTVRINGADTPWHSDDLAAVVKARPDAVVVPKVETPEDVLRVAARLDAGNIPSSVRVWAMMETPRAVLNAHEIAATAVRNPDSRLSMLVIGTNDLAKATRTEIVPDRWTMMPWLMTFVAAARACGLEILDGAYNNFRDESGLRRETEQGREMGMDGKTLIHPDQVVPCNQIFTPSPAEVSEARRIIAAFEMPENRGKGVISVDGKMVELLHADMARRTVAIAEAVGALPSA